MSDEAELQAYREFFAKLDIRPMLKQLMYGGFDNYTDYEKHGDAFVTLKPRPERILQCSICHARRELKEMLEDPRYDLRFERCEFMAECDGCGCRTKFIPED